MGFPTKRDEEWKYTSIKGLLKPAYKLVSPFASEDSDEQVEFKDIKQYMVNDIDCYKVVFINGCYSSWLSETTHQGFDVCTVGSAWKKYPEMVDAHFAKLSSQGGPLSQLNTALAWDGLYVRVPKGVIVDKAHPGCCISPRAVSQPLSRSRSLIILESGAHAEVIERHQSITKEDIWVNAVDEVFMDDNSSLHWVKLQHDRDSASFDTAQHH